LGCLIDSYIGAVYQSLRKAQQPGGFWDRMDKEKQNSFVNWLSTGSGGIIALILLLIF